MRINNERRDLVIINLHKFLKLFVVAARVLGSKVCSVGAVSRGIDAKPGAENRPGRISLNLCGGTYD
jgi:hypothetical protein